MDSITSQGGCQCIKSETNIFEGESQQISHDKGYWVDHYSTSSTTGSAPLDFNIVGSHDLYIDLNSTYIRFYFKIVNEDGTDLNADEIANLKVGVINLPLHTVFSQIDVYLNDRLITDGSPTYAYRSYLSTLLSYSVDAKFTQLQGSLYFKDEAGNMNDVVGGNDGLETRSIYAKQGIELFGRLHSDIFHQDKYMLNSVNIRVKCLRNSDDFVMMYSNALPKKYKYQISDVSL